jgi:hypothetical protein
VKARHLGPLGPDAFGDAFDGYIVAEAALRVGGREPFAEIPVLIEAWACVPCARRSTTPTMRRSAAGRDQARSRTGTRWRYGVRHPRYVH